MEQIHTNCSLKKIKLRDSMFGVILVRVFTIPMLGKRKKEKSLCCDWEGIGLSKDVRKMRYHLKMNYTYLNIYYGETVETVSDFILGRSKITADGDCSQEIKRRLLLGKKVMTTLESIFKSRDITLPTKSIYSRLWFFQWSCMDARVGL